MELLTLYAQRMPAKAAPGEYDVCVYADRAGKTLKGRFAWYLSSKPTRRNKYVMLNCYRWRLEWLPARTV